MVLLTELLEIHNMVQHLSGIVEQTAFRLLYHLADRQVLQTAAGQQLVQVVGVGL